ncbi:patatin-like phospholipase family protein [Rhizobium halophytocola]|uniref:Acylesterase/phospholipase RssA n=1 Tax=Rhizobium halophytocola TaxID=735519 RepID=A0ABS4DZF0_9HYPH|nr:patatin-like phospholipase family protein [Rhizobium halophytocola]MBP1851066.1 putative acylesterase/phospholipase RssA [Rhizobium halophytocola]
MQDLSFDVIGYAGGGNRCYWQSGFVEALNARYPQKPRHYVAVSAGAYHCAMNLIGIGERVRSAAYGFAGEHRPDIDWRALRSGRSPLVVGDLFRQFLAREFGPLELSALKAAPPILIQVSHPPAWMPASMAAIGSITAYQIEKLLTGGRHSRAGRYLGLTPAWISTHDMATPEDLVGAIMASSSVPPFMPVGRINGRPALDGGLTDNPPLARLAQAEDKGLRTLLMTTRHGRAPPSSPGRTIVGPSEEITVNKFTVGDEAGLRHAFEVGLRDGERFAARLPALLGGRRRQDPSQASA